MEVRAETGGCRITAFPGARPYRLLLDAGEFLANPDWYWRFRHRAEGERGLDETEDLLHPGTFRARLEPGQTLTFIVTAETEEPESAATAAEQDSERKRSLFQATPEDAPEWIRRLTLAADQFIVSRASSATDGTASLTGKTVIAGYPWFSDWGRDTMIALARVWPSRPVASLTRPPFCAPSRSIQAKECCRTAFPTAENLPSTTPSMPALVLSCDRYVRRSDP